MDAGEKKLDAKARQRLLASVDKMLRSGRLTDQEAGRLRAAGATDDLDDVVRDLGIRHASDTLGQAVQDGRMTQSEADAMLARLRDGEHPRSPRAHLRGMRRAGGVPATARPDQDRPAGRPS